MSERDQPIYCINLAASVERRARMERRLRHHKLIDRTQFVEAIPADSPLVDQRLEGLVAQAADPVGRAVAACYASHLKALHTLVEHHPEQDGAIVFEDDALLHNDWHRRLHDVLDNLPGGTSLCLLSYLVTAWDRTRWAGRQPERHNLCTFVPAETWGAQAYWISRRYATEVIERWDIPLRHLPPKAGVERVVIHCSGGLLCYPPLAIEDAIDSQVRPNDVGPYHVPLLRGWPYADYAACEEGRDESPLAPSRRGSATTLGLAVIARDEEESLPALLASCDGAFDEIVLLDTGSKDRTVDLFLAWAETQPATRCHIEHFPWGDHFAAARQRADDLLSTEWKVWADCDDEIIGAARLRDVAANAPTDQAGYRFGYDYARDASGTCTCYFKRERLVRAGRGHWVGPVHEVQNIDGRVTDIDSEIAQWIHHRERKAASGRARPPRPDIAVLTAELERHPDDPRTVFYLAQSHRDVGELTRAIELYEQRADMGGAVEEVFYSIYQAGLLRALEGDWIGGTRLLLQAWEYRPSRAEPLYELAWRFRAVGDHRSAYLFARHGLDRPQPEDALFVQPWVYRWGLLFECSISAYWVGETAEAERACEELLAMVDLPDAHRKQTTANLEMVRRRRMTDGPPPTKARTRRRAPISQTGEIRLDVQPPWPSVRATLATSDAPGLQMIVRTTQPHGERSDASVSDPAEDRLSADYLVALTDGLVVASVAPLAVKTPNDVLNIERHWDDRLVNLNGSWHALARLELDEGRSCAGLLTIDGASITDCLRLDLPVDDGVTHTWLPFVSHGALHFAQFGARMLVCRYDSTRRSLDQVGDGSAVAWGGELLDGSTGVPVDDGVLFVVSLAEQGHASVDVTHRLVLLDPNYVLSAVSRPFTVLASPGEACAGLARMKDRLVLAFAANERASLALLELDAALDLLE